MQVSKLQQNYKKLKLSLYEENIAEAVQDTERPRPWKVQKGRSRMGLQPNKFAETYIKKGGGGGKRRRKTKECLSLHRRPGATEKETSDAHLTGSGRTAQPEAVVLPRLGLCSRIGWSHVELHVLDLPITQAVDQVVGLSPGDLPIACEDIYQCWVVDEGMSSAGPPPGGAIRTSHPRLRPVRPPTSSPTPEAFPE